MLKSKAFWSAAIIAAVVIFLAGINLTKLYKSEVKILFVPKSEMAAENIGRITQDAQEIFLLHERGAEIKTDRKSDVASVFAKGMSRIETEALALKSTHNIAIEMSRYYNIKKDLDIRIIGGPVTAQEADAFNIEWILIAIISGLAIGIIAWLFQGSASFLQFPAYRPAATQRSEQASSKPSFPDYSSEPSFAGTFQEQTFPEALSEDEVEPAISANKKAAAPENLPIGEEILIVKKKPELASEEKRHEATPEEVKERLNKLLRGEM